MRGSNGMMDLKKWDCGVPGKEKTLWEGGLFKLEVTFPDEYPTKPPKCTSQSYLGTQLRRSFGSTPAAVHANVPQASSCLRCSIPTYIPLAPSACLS